MSISRFCVTMCGKPKYKNRAQPHASVSAVPDFLLFSGWTARRLYVKSAQISGSPVTHCFQNGNDASAKWS